MIESELRRHVNRLWTILGNFGGELEAPRLGRLANGELAFDLVALLPGPAAPHAPEVTLGEVWSPAQDDAYRLSEYRYEFVERPLNRRMAFHRHDEETFLARHDVAVHEHCEEVLGKPVCGHYHGLPVSAYEAIQAFMVLWGQSGPIGCDARKCMD